MPLFVLQNINRLISEQIVSVFVNNWSQTQKKGKYFKRENLKALIDKSAGSRKRSQFGDMETTEVVHLLHLKHIHCYHDHHQHHHHHHHNVKRRQSGVGSGWRGNLGFSLEATPHPPLHHDHHHGDNNDVGDLGDDDQRRQ